MEMEQQASVECEQIFHLESVIFNEGECAATTSSQPVKKQTRQWAAWTRQEEETFFSALRQVGKNFEKITSRVQSKNKDQVRHYYYRLVRRMNKLLGPEFCLDAKNSKDTNAAMLRWWSLLEKYSCKASKLHLKPRRFKIFVETLEQQLMKDRKKVKRKRLSQEESCSPPPSSVTVPGAVKVVFVDKRNIQKLGTAKGPSFRRNGNIKINQNNCKGESSCVKKAKQRRKPALTAAYKRWEKAAYAGVSLVADAAEHLERAAEDNVVEILQNIQVTEQNITEPIQKDVPSLPSSSQGPTKLKLQLFPIDEITRKALETDSHNPYLELTLSTRKKISSVLEHMSRKWGTSSIATGELVLVPYFAQKETILNSQKWTVDSSLTAADVYSLIGSPQIFRLRYCWLTNATSSPKNLPEPSEADERVGSGTGWTAGEWADSLTNISIGDLLLSSASPELESVEQIPFTCDSFDAAVAAHIYKHQNKSNLFNPTLAPISSSILDADETCDGFKFGKDSAFAQKVQLRNDFPRPSDEVAAMILTDIKEMDEKAENADDGTIPTTNGDPKDDIQPDRQSMDDPPKDLNGLTDIYWSDSLGALDLDIIPPTCRYHSEDLILTDSVSGLNRLIANSLDAFQNCSFFGLDKKDTAVSAPTVEPQET